MTTLFNQLKRVMFFTRSSQVMFLVGSILLLISCFYYWNYLQVEVVKIDVGSQKLPMLLRQKITMLSTLRVNRSSAYTYKIKLLSTFGKLLSKSDKQQSFQIEIFEVLPNSKRIRLNGANNRLSLLNGSWFLIGKLYLSRGRTYTLEIFIQDMRYTPKTSFGYFSLSSRFRYVKLFDVSPGVYWTLSMLSFTFSLLFFLFMFISGYVGMKQLSNSKSKD